ncbi:MAG: hypothetical protein LUE06_00645 [Oscillospiraceae bacterium]|nr:hypothetical protein [Oscillospiraceae bacterium]
MSIIMVDCADGFKRADKLADYSARCAACAAALGEENTMLSAELIGVSQRLAQLGEDVRRGSEVWDDFYRRNVRLD